MSVSLLLTNLKVTGSNVIYNANLTGIGGAQVFTSGNFIYISGGAGGGGGGTVTQGQLDALSGFSTGISGYLQNVIVNSGQQLYSLNTGLSGYLIGLIGASSAGVASINGLSGVLNIGGAGNISIFNVGQNITVSGNTGDYALFAQKTSLTQTGQTLYNYILATSGTIGSTGTSLYGYIVSLSGQFTSMSGQLATNLTLTGQTLLNNIISTSGSLANTGQILYNLINNSSGLYVPTGTIISYLTGVPTGLDTSFFWFQNYIFPSIPRVYIAIELSGSNTLYGVSISGRATSGFWATFTDTVLETGIYLDVLAKS